MCAVGERMGNGMVVFLVHLHACGGGECGGGKGRKAVDARRRPVYHQSPWAFMASATLMNPATLAPARSEGSTSSVCCSPDHLVPALKQIWESDGSALMHRTH